MKLLILGESDSIGWMLEDRSLGWGNVLPVELERRLGSGIDCTHLTFYTHTPTALTYLEKVLARGPFDTVVFSTTTIGFSLLSVDRRIARLFGARAGDALRSTVDSFDRKTRRRGEHGWRRQINRTTHFLARNTIGQDPMTSYGTTLENHKLVLGRLARLEDTDVIVLGPTNHGGALARRVRKTQSNVDTFRAELREEALRRRLTWVDRQLLSEMTRDRDAEFTDGLHKGPAFHARIVEATIAAMRAAEAARPALAR